MNDTTKEPNLIQPFGKNLDISPRYLRDKGATAMFGLSRTKLYTLAKQGKIKSVSLQEVGTSRGCRLFEVASIQNFIDSFE